MLSDSSSASVFNFQITQPYKNYQCNSTKKAIIYEASPKYDAVCLLLYLLCSCWHLVMLYHQDHKPWNYFAKLIHTSIVTECE